MKPGSPEWEARLKYLIDEELKGKHVGWYWLSFADPDKPKGEQFLGVSIVYAHGITTGTIEARRLGINPGGEVVGILLERVPHSRFLNRLLNRQEAKEAENSALN